jgi:dipeptidyl aminopeptidase/acylaminoacyl peptidase
MKPFRRECASRFAAVVFLAAAAAASAPATAQDTAALPSVQGFFRNADVGAMRLSPSGRWLAMTARARDSRVALAVVDVEGKEPISIAAQFSDADIRSFRWVEDDRLVFNLVDDEAGGTDQRFGPGLFSVRRDGSEIRELIKSRQNFFARASQVVRETLGTDHALLMVPRDGSGEVIVGKYIFTSRGDFESLNALRLNAATGRTRNLSMERPANVKQWIFDPKGEPRVTIAEADGVRSVYWRAPGQEGWKKISSGPSLRQKFLPRFVDEAGRLYVTTNIGREGTAALKLFDFATGEPEAEPIVKTPGFDFSGELLSDAIGDSVFGVGVLTDAWTTVWFDARMKAIQKIVDEQLPGRVNVLSCSRCKDPQLVLVHSWSDQDPGRFWLYRPAANTLTALGRVRNDIEPAKMATLDFVRAKARDGLDLPIWVTTPRKEAPGLRDGKRAAVVVVHGGPWIRGGSWRWDAGAQFLASRGYVVIEPEFRGSTGYGARHFRAGWKSWEGPMQDDVADALKHVAAAGLVDPQRVCIAGASYGGYATLMGLIRYPDLYRCGVAWIAVSDPRLLFEDSWRSDLSDEARNHTLPTLIGDPQQDAAMLRSAAPLERAPELRAPLLLAYGRDDRRVPLKHGELMREALRAQGRDPQWVVYDGEGHGFHKVEHKVDFWSRVERFLDVNIGPGAAR